MKTKESASTLKAAAAYALAFLTNGGKPGEEVAVRKCLVEALKSSVK